MSLKRVNPYLKYVFFTVLIIAFIVVYKVYLQPFLQLEAIHRLLPEFRLFVENNKALAIVLFSLVYLVTTALSFPGASLLTLLAGALFGLFAGTIIVSFMSTMGASLAFLTSRYLFRDHIQNRFPEWYERINKGFSAEGSFYLLSLRLAPIVPFYLVNLLMGLTTMRIGSYFLLSQIGMLPGTIVYVYAGVEIGKIQTLSDIVSAPVFLAMLGLAVLPWVAKTVLSIYKNKKLYSRFKKPKHFDYNVVVIGGGAAGLVTSYVTSALQARVALIEKHKMGGDCLNYGCVPSKSLLSVAKRVHELKSAGDIGLDASVGEVDFVKVMNHVRAAILKIEPNDSAQRYEKLGVECLSGNAKILSPFEVQVGDKILTTKNIVIATGAAPYVPPIKNLTKYLTSETLWELRSLPKTLTVIGGGAIGCEMAQAFARLGSSVRLIQKSPRLIERSEAEAAHVMEELLEADGVKIYYNTVVLEQTETGLVIQSKSGEKQQLESEQVLVAVGRKPRLEGFGLEELGIIGNSAGFVEHNEFLQTRFPNILLCGDVAGPMQLTHVAAHQAGYATLNALFAPFKSWRQDLSCIPQVTYTSPEIAQVGFTEDMAKTQKLNYEVTFYDMEELDRAICEKKNLGFVKIITRKGSDKILGATVVCDRAGEVLSEITFAKKNGLGLKKIFSTVHAYPSWSEATKFAAGKWQMSHKPEWALKFLKMFFNWRRT
jgi:pyruvate/2-oxoglutarate dehydrogenase complex dihydrolipoamide dehydrogenase (E3) component/uncharacterized membrane protein YdjX (TVP38/TMEM64 family)